MSPDPTSTTTPAPTTPPPVVKTADPLEFVDALSSMRSQVSAFKALGSKKFTAFFVLAGLNLFIGWEAIKQDRVIGVIFFGLATVLGIAYLATQAYVDAAQIRALAEHTASAEYTEALERVED